MANVPSMGEEKIIILHEKMQKLEVEMFKTRIPKESFFGPTLTGKALLLLFLRNRKSNYVNKEIRVGKSWYSQYPGFRGTFSKQQILLNI